MNTSNIFMNDSSDIRLSQTHQEWRDKCERMEHSINEWDGTFGNEDLPTSCSLKLDTKYENIELTHQTETVTKDVKPTENKRGMSTFKRSKKDRNGDYFAYVGNENLRDSRRPAPCTNDYGTKFTNPCKNSDPRSRNGRLVGSFSTFTDYTCPRALRGGGLAPGSGIQNEEDELFSWIGKYHPEDVFTFGEAKKGEKTDNNVKEMPQSSPLEPMNIKNKIGSAAIDISQSVISTFISESICSIIDSSREKGFQNTDFSEILTNAFGSSMQTFKQQCLTETTRIGFKCLSATVTQLQCVEGPLKYMSIIWEIISKLKDFLGGSLTLWQLIYWLLYKAVCLGIGLFIACIFGPVGFAFATAISIALNVIKHLVNQWFQ